ncbi:GYD domain-containing protein [Maribius pontilimi]|uniref:GYD domain-containing protein n=1 Tax=Palleronia pontilimi TaxID=1964209 RepID=A0A934IGS4_9RHOB|nr:GYD domain-containing protein [Palleronia pontilimi]MBJ3762613.1 GYD domain-containing protein [Palleronia pontilimi]
MPFYMFQGRYTAQALKALVDTSQDREKAARPLIEAVGGKLHQFFYCMGEDDVMVLIEAPDDTAMAACALAVGASGAMAGGKTTKLVTNADAMKAMAMAKKASASYKAATG